MKTTRQRSKPSFEDLISGYYGKARGEARTFEEVLAGYYGLRRASAPKPTAAVMTLSRDDGEVLQQPGTAPAPVEPLPDRPASGEEYVVWSAETPAAAPVASAAPVAAAAPAAPEAPAPPPVEAPIAAPASVAHDVTPAEEYAVDVLQPLDPTPTSHATSALVSPALEEDELAADMRAILSGEKVYDPGSGRTVDRESLGGERREAAAPPQPALPQFSNEHAIFDAIREQMTYANAYDLGTVEVENRFADFDRVADSTERANAAKAVGAAPATPTAPEGPKVGGEEFLADLDEIRTRAEGAADDAVRRAAESMPRAYTSSIADWSDSPMRDAACPPSALKLALAGPQQPFTRPMWDAGEHALAGGDLYPNQLRVGRGAGVPFSYGELIAMGDLYETPQEMMGADPAELGRLKELIDRNTEYYRAGKSTPSLDVSNKEWNDATGKRYLRLAEENYDHFSPNTIFDDAVARAATKHGTNRQTWETYHAQAIEEAQKLALLPENRNRSYIPEDPLIINAFADHFLTDAFASGHLINKEVMMAYFRKNFFSGSKLNDAAQDFFDRLAKAAFVGKVKEKFSVLETVDYPVCAWGWCFKWRPNIDSVNMFRKLLVAAAEQETDKVGNFAVKALHDELNENGVEVTNAAGDGQWKLTGDQFLNPKSLAVMRKAVQQSVDNINDPSILASNLNFGPYFAKVWRYVPQPTPSERERIKRLVQEYTNPRSTTLSNAAAEVIRKQVDMLIDVLIDEKKLKPA